MREERNALLVVLGAVLAVAVTTAVAFSGGAMEKSSIFEDGKPVLRSSGSVIVSPAAFTPYDVPSGLVFEHLNGKLWVFGCAMAAVDLPYGVQVSSLSTVLWDNNNPEDVTLTLYRSQMTSPTGRQVAQVASSGAATIWSPYFDLGPDVRYSTAESGHVFYLVLCATGSDNGFPGALITYN